MKRLLYIVLIISVAGISCSTTGVRKTARLEERAREGKVIGNAIENDRYIINIERLYTRGGFMVDMVPGANFIAINNNRARINVGYMGRSYDTMPIAAINMNGYIVDKRVSPNKNGGYTVNLKVKENNDIFNLSMVISPGGKCDVGISHPRIDHARYRGEFRLQ